MCHCTLIIRSLETLFLFLYSCLNTEIILRCLRPSCWHDAMFTNSNYGWSRVIRLHHFNIFTILIVSLIKVVYNILVLLSLVPVVKQRTHHSNQLENSLAETKFTRKKTDKFEVIWFLKRKENGTRSIIRVNFSGFSRFITTGYVECNIFRVQSTERFFRYFFL